jgi:hypothetical protein
VPIDSIFAYKLMLIWMLICWTRWLSVAVFCHLQGCSQADKMDFLLSSLSPHPVSRLTALRLSRFIPKVRFLMHQVAKGGNHVGVRVSKVSFKKPRKSLPGGRQRQQTAVRYTKTVPELRKGKWVFPLSFQVGHVLLWSTHPLGDDKNPT